MALKNKIDALSSGANLLLKEAKEIFLQIITFVKKIATLLFICQPISSIIFHKKNSP